MGIRGTVRRAQDGHIIHRQAPTAPVRECLPSPCCCRGLLLEPCTGPRCTAYNTARYTSLRSRMLASAMGVSAPPELVRSWGASSAFGAKT